MRDSKIDVNSMLYGYYIQYQKLLELTNQTINGDPRYNNCDKINVYIDLYNFLMPLYTPNISTDKKYVIAAGIINLAAHMREYYYSRHKVYSNIYLIYGDETSTSHKQFLLNFGNTKFKETLNYKEMNEKIESQLKMVKMICDYINGVYFIRRTTDFAIVAYDEIRKQPNNIPAVVLTKSSYSYQIPAVCDNCVLLRPKKYNGMDTSIAITNTNVLFQVCDKTNSDKNIQKLITLNSELLSLLMVLTGIKSVCVSRLLNSTSAINKLYKAIQDNKIINGYNSDMDYVYNNLDISNTIDITNFKYRFNAIDLVFQHRIYSNSPESKDVSHLIDLNNREDMHKINNVYFADNPLNLDVF